MQQPASLLSSDTTFQNIMVKQTTTVLVLLVYCASSAPAASLESISSWATIPGVFPGRRYEYQQRHRRWPSLFTCNQGSYRGTISCLSSSYYQRGGKSICFISNTFANSIPCNNVRSEILHKPVFREDAPKQKSFLVLSSTRSKSAENSSSTSSSEGKKRNEKKQSSSKPTNGRQRMKKSEIDDLVRGMYFT